MAPGGGILRLIDAGYVPLASQSPYPIVVYSLAHHRRLCLNHTVQKDSREVLGTSFRFRPTSEILENIQYGGSSVVKTDSQRSRFIAREAWFTVLLTKFAFIVTFAEFLDLYSKQSF